MKILFAALPTIGARQPAPGHRPHGQGPRRRRPVHHRPSLSGGGRGGRRLLRAAGRRGRLRLPQRRQGSSTTGRRCRRARRKSGRSWNAGLSTRCHRRPLRCAGVIAAEAPDIIVADSFLLRHSRRSCSTAPGPRPPIVACGRRLAGARPAGTGPPHGLGPAAAGARRGGPPPLRRDRRRGRRRPQTCRSAPPPTPSSPPMGLPKLPHSFLPVVGAAGRRLPAADGAGPSSTTTAPLPPHDPLRRGRLPPPSTAPAARLVGRPRRRAGGWCWWTQGTFRQPRLRRGGRADPGGRSPIATTCW